MKTVSVSPHVHSSLSTDKAMLFVIIALLPSAIWGVFAFGLRALLVLLVSIASCVIVEYIMGRIIKENTIRDYSAIVTGLLIGMNMSPLIPLYIPVIASVFAIVVVKWTFGGLGCNWMNPALAGRVFVFFSFSSAMSTFIVPRYVYGLLLSQVIVVSEFDSSCAKSITKLLCYEHPTSSDLLNKLLDFLVILLCEVQDLVVFTHF